ncbi:tetratricopeptide repeat-containing sulfotransferase family protein [Parasedimentitalea psychrophila]|uniref:Sulfotransferase n=1 Tax=Parasedimentitalea psychrophila TaxID=2997337 RepID=A0A9Y2P212_9RHOB|nr:sulfotransferase [Parasedimentitalea psychrophila]WIY24602.1 sulfotransferase [Parasedimentitalea psychrophila]
MSNSAQLDISDRDMAAQSSRQILKTADHLMERRQYRMALAGLLPLMQESSLDVAVLDRTASCYFQLGDCQAAISLVEVLIQLRPDLTAGWGKLAAMKHSLGDKQGAIEGYRKVLKEDKNSVFALAALNRLDPFRRDGQKASRLRKLSKSPKSPKLSNAERSAVFSALGQIEHASNRPNSAFRFFAKAKAAQKADYSPEVMEQLVDGQIEKFRKNTTTECHRDGPRIVFVMGMPRSGTTLVETILARHSIVGTAGESTALSKTLQVVRQHIKDTQRGADVWDWFGQLSEQEIAIFRQSYYGFLSQGTTVSNDVIVDKMPGNSLHLGLAHMLLPNAKFIFMSRHPLDVGLSNFSTIFGTGNQFSSRLDWIGQTTRSVYRSIEDYKQKLPDQLRIQSYQGLVTNPEIQIRALLDHAGLSWEPDCLSPQDAEGAIRTASVEQAREKINTRALGKWQPYEQQLQPLVDALGGPEWIQAWQTQDKMSASC